MSPETIWGEGWLEEEKPITLNQTERKILSIICENYEYFDKAPTTRRKVQHDILGVSDRMINKSLRRLWLSGYIKIEWKSLFGGQTDLITPTYKALSWWRNLFGIRKSNRESTYSFF